MVDGTISQFPCLGMSILGMCSYNPAQPANIYFSLGEALSALGFTIAIQQFLKPIYLFRLQAYGIRLKYLFLAIFIGFLCSLIATVLPNLPITYDNPLCYPIVWEIIGTLLIGLVFGLTAYISLRPAQIFNWTLITFVRAAGHLLSKADDGGRVSFAEDLLENFPKLVSYAAAFQKAENHAVQMEFERLREANLPQEIRGNPPENTAFYQYAHRNELEKATYAATLLRLISDTKFCSALVTKCPWLTAAIMNDISRLHLYSSEAKPFVQEIAYRAVVNEQSIMAREVGFYGFSSAPILSDSLFSDWFILNNYHPLDKLNFGIREQPSEGYLTRLNAASKMMLETAMRAQDYWSIGYMYSVKNAYKSWFLQDRVNKTRGLESNSTSELYIGIKSLHDKLTENFPNLEARIYKQLFIADEARHRSDLVSIVASIVKEGFEGVANYFKGFDDNNWSNVIMLFGEVFPMHGDYPAGMTPLQQQVAIKLIKKLKQNMEGWYPSISRVLLAVIGPYESGPPIPNRTAFVILRDAVYRELQKLPQLHAAKPDRVKDFLPDNVTYDTTTNTLIHKYADGETQSTDLSGLNIPEINLLDSSNWNLNPSS